jgi:hypothetical protein
MQQYIGVLIFLLIGACCGVLMAGHIDSISQEGTPFGEVLLPFGLLIIGIYLAIFLHIIIHEAGHLVFGLMTGYRFSSFRIGSFMWIKENGKLRLRKLSLAGTGGQCLMAPPDMVDGKIPFVLYNFGGAIFNTIFGLFFIGLYVIFSNIPILSMLFLYAALIGFAYSLMNGIPLRLGMVDNDGYNALSIGKNREALRSYWIMMKVNEQTSKGVRIKDMPEEWFIIPSPESMKNSISVSVAVFAFNRFMDAHEFEKASHLLENLLEMDTAMIGLYRNLMINDRIFFELIGENRKEKLDQMLNKQQVNFMKTMRNSLSILRTQYAYALLSEKDEQKASKIREQFEKSALVYPYPSEVESERELVSGVRLE